MNQQSASNPAQTTRRSFLETTAVAGTLAALGNVHAAGSDVLRLGLIGCGNRGNGAAQQALRADASTRLVALADVFADQVQRSIDVLKRSDLAARVDVDAEHRFVGFDAYQRLINSGVDVVLMAAPPQFRPAHIEAAVRAGKHIFAEKPIAVDAPGVRRVRAACAEARQRNTAVGSGLCWRYHTVARASLKQIHDGAIGPITALHSTYNAALPNKPWPMRRQADWTDMEWQLRNWYWFTWLSGDHIVEQAVHSIDKAAWAERDRPPAAAVGMGGLQSRTAAERGQIFDHHAVVYEYADGVKHFHFCRQQNGTARDVSVHIHGTRGSCHVETGTITDLSGRVTWRCEERANVMHQAEHDELFASIRAGRPLNDGEFMSLSTMQAILGRMASYTGQRVTWEQALESQEDLTPPHYAWGPLPQTPVALPGVTRLR